MFISNGDSEGIISFEKPLQYDENKNIQLSRDIQKSEIDEVCKFIRQNNTMSSGNITLITKNQLENYSNLNSLFVLMRGGNKNSLLGTILGLPLPIKCLYKKGEEIIIHSCTTFLNVVDKLRGFGLCMALIRELIQYGFDKKIYCGYHTVPMKIGDNSIELYSWYRPIDLEKCVESGFLYPGYNDPRSEKKNKLKYKVKIPKNCKIEKICGENCEKALFFYYELVREKKFVFYPDLELWKKWIQIYPTFLVTNKEKYIGIFSYSTIYCEMKNTIEDSKLALPIICNGEISIILECLIYEAWKSGHHLIYTYLYGDIDESNLQKIRAIKSDSKSYFCLYNNGLKLTVKDISIPLL